LDNNIKKKNIGIGEKQMKNTNVIISVIFYLYILV